MDIKITKDKTIVQGVVYVVMSHCYMGMDGDYYQSHCAYTSEEDALKVCAKMERDSEHVNSEYDHEMWYVEPLVIKA